MDARLVRIAWRPFSVPFWTPLVTGAGTWSSREGFIVEATAAAGATVVSEASPMPGGPAMADVAEALDKLARRLLAGGAGPLDLPVVSCPPARFAIEAAQQMTAALERGVPLYSCLAGAGTGAPSPGVPLNALVDAGTPAAAARQSAKAARAGFTAVKLKVGCAAHEDIARVAAVRDAIGPGVELRIDANGAWDDDTALKVLEAAAAAGVVLCEQPVAPGPTAVAAFKRLREAGVPLAIDEACRSLAEMQPFLDAGAMDAVVLKPMATGLEAALSMAALARQRSLQVIVTTTFDAAPGTLLAMHIAAAVSGDVPCGLATLDLLEHPLVEGAPPIQNGSVALPETPGCALELDRKALERYALGPWVEVRHG